MIIMKSAKCKGIEKKPNLIAFRCLIKFVSIRTKFQKQRHGLCETARERDRKGRSVLSSVQIRLF